MAWLQSHQKFSNDPKTNKLKRKLNISVHETVGILHFVWYWALEYAGDGDLSNFTAEDIADGCQYTKDAEFLYSALLESGYIEESEDGKKRLHFWDEIGGKLLISREKAKERVGKSRAEKKKGNANVTRNISETYAIVTAQDLDLDLELDKEEDQEQDQNIMADDTPKVEPTKKDYVPAPCKETVQYINKVTGKAFKFVESNYTLIKARWKEGYTFEDFVYVIDVKAEEWLGTDKEQWLTPVTLFRPSNFAGYRNQKFKKDSARRGNSGKPIVQGIRPEDQQTAGMSAEEWEAARAMAQKLDERLNCKR